MVQKTSIRFFNKTAVRAVWDRAGFYWLYSATDVVAALVNSSNPRAYWNKAKARNPQLAAFCTQMKLTASDGKRYLADCLTQSGVDALLLALPGKYRLDFSEWIAGMSSPLDERSKMRAYELWDSPLLDEELAGTVEGLRQVHAFLFGGLYDFAGKTRTKNISKGGFQFANCMYLDETLASIEAMPDSTVDEIIDKYVEMNVAHPFMEGNGRATRIWLDMLLKKRMGKCVDWSRIDKKEYLATMERSVADSTEIQALLTDALTDDVDNRELFMKGIDYSYYYEVVEE